MASQENDKVAGAIERLTRSTWDSRVLPSRADVGVVLDALTVKQLALQEVARPYGMLDLAVTEHMHGPRGDDMLAVAKIVRAAIADNSLVSA